MNYIYEDILAFAKSTTTYYENKEEFEKDVGYNLRVLYGAKIWQILDENELFINDAWKAYQERRDNKND